MAPSTRSALFAAVLTLAAAPAFAQAPAASPLQRIGAAAAVAGRVFATAPSATVGRVVGSGKPIFLNDHVTTDAAGRLQVLLLDQTVFTLGPNSDMVLDEFVYDPNTNAGRLQASVVKGAFRFVSGHMAHEGGSNMKIRTPSGTMGIRGTIVVGQVSDQSSTLILAGPGANNNAGEAPGQISVSNGQGSVVIDHPGYGTTVANGMPPTPPAPMQLQLTQISGQVASNAGAPSSGKGGGQQASNGGSTGGTQQASNAGPSNATSAAGQDTASGQQQAQVTSDVQATNDDAATVTTFVNQDVTNVVGLADGVSTFDQIQANTLNGVLVGQDIYSMSGSYACTSGGCGSGVAGTVSMNLEVDWGGRTLGSFGSSITLNSASSVNGSFGGDSISVFSVPFPSTTGPAVLTFGSGDFNSGSSGSMSSMTVALKNVGGVVAKQAAASFSYGGFSGESITGGATGTRAPAPPQ